MKKLTLSAVLLAFVVIVVGAFTRLSDAGLGCPDWPGCYGFWKVPASELTIAEAAKNFPEAPLEAEKAHIEMGHRYLAGTLGLMIFAIAVLSLRKRLPARKVAAGTAILVCVQAAFGMWTVTLKLSPIIVLTHLMLGLTTLCCLWWFYLQQSGEQKIEANLPLLVLALVGAQIFLGGWTSTNYAALACPNFPNCADTLAPAFDFSKALNLFGGITFDNPLTFMDHSARMTIHMLHRIGAIFATIAVIALSISLLKRRLLVLSAILIGLVCLQVSLGITNIVNSLPIHVAVAHNGVAALLLLAILTSMYYWPKERPNDE